MEVGSFSSRHIGVEDLEKEELLEVIGFQSVEDLVSATIPKNIRLGSDLNLESGFSESEYLRHIEELGNKNDQFTNFIGMGYYGTIIPSVVRRNILENPGWYTAYTPYQAEISQGRLECLLNFQTMVSDLTGMPLANASLLDESTAAAEAMIMLYNSRSRELKKNDVNKFFVSELCYPQTIDVLRTRANPLGIQLEIGSHLDTNLDDSYFGMMLQYPAEDGAIHNYEAVVEQAKNFGIKVAVAADIMSLVLLTPPGEWGADVVVGSTQRFGVPMGFGGPHAGYFATLEENKRFIPGRIIGVSQDKFGNQGLRMALQTREQHIKRDRATSNICTAQALLAIIASNYAVYHGPEGLKKIAYEIHYKASNLAKAAESLGYINQNELFFDTLRLKLPTTISQDKLKNKLVSQRINVRYFDSGEIGISVDETTTIDQLTQLISILSNEGNAALSKVNDLCLGEIRHSDILTHNVFHSYHTETKLMRYLKSLENKDISLTRSMISLGSCTMKLNAASQLYPITNPKFSDIHPFAPVDQNQGYIEMINSLEAMLCEVTGFDAMSFQPNSGAQGEYAGLMVIRDYFKANGQEHRNIALIPQSAHGTNPASAVMAGMKVVVVKCDESGNIDVNDLREKAETHQENLAALMVTYPSTHGVFEESIQEVTSIIHSNGGQVYMDGANMNAQVGLTNPYTIGADVCHLNLHKTFAIPHGGGGPGVGPIGVAKHLAPFLPGHTVINSSNGKSNPAVSGAPWGSALILLISYGYCKMLGKEGLKKSTEIAILNANYMKTRLEEKFEILYKGNNNTVAHEMIVDCRSFKKSAGVEVEDIAKRLIDYGFHAPTVSFPVAGTLMIEPTESESKDELDRFCDALLNIHSEIQRIQDGTWDVDDNPLKNAPHTALEVCSDKWEHQYSREEAAFPLDWIKENKYWVPVKRVDNAYGDRNLICTCPAIEDYEQEPVTI
ncbi:MAG: aminomethyl-transferring glycine dehydrogenase [Flavobacteriales bacterium]|nr:aminomethyl-transferring glycine dehydrogenase [Flavobacteriales bacterium]